MQTDLPPADDAEARYLVRRAFDRQPEAGFTPARLASALALPVATVQSVLTELVDAGLIVRLDDEYVSTLHDD